MAWRAWFAGSSPLTRGKLQILTGGASIRRLIPAHAGKTSSSLRRWALEKAHPRSRGENRLVYWPTRTVMGSSPLTRGKLRRDTSEGQRVRLIPAHAGKTAAACLRGVRLWAHPRSRGENSFQVVGGSLSSGSSPLTRGKLTGGGSNGKSVRLIPAHAGKTRSINSKHLWEQAHPRSRGENGEIIDKLNSSVGSSPLTRGKLTCPIPSRCSIRLIPAHAGKTSVRQRSPCARAAHPRSRGENGWMRGCLGGPLGSSPLTRGKPRGPIMGQAAEGLIPAHAGKTRRSRCSYSPDRAHPRSRGENSVQATAMLMSAGSSPLTRGKQAGYRLMLPQMRLIPAHAGKTPRRVWANRGAGAHPRSRGENTVHELDFLRSVGSSPLTRGKPEDAAANPAHVRLIPAHAGKTGKPTSSQRGRAAHPRSRGENAVRISV